MLYNLHLTTQNKNSNINRGNMSEKNERSLIAVDPSVRDDLKILAAIKKVSIKKYLKELVESEKAKNVLSPKPDFTND